MAHYDFWQVQDKVPASVIQAFTSTCSREDCCVSFRMGETKCMSTSDHYDKRGNLIIEDRNSFRGEICCSECWRGATIDHKGNLTDEFTPTEETTND